MMNLTSIYLKYLLITVRLAKILMIFCLIKRIYVFVCVTYMYISVDVSKVFLNIQVHSKHSLEKQSCNISPIACQNYTCKGSVFYSFKKEVLFRHMIGNSLPLVQGESCGTEYFVDDVRMLHELMTLKQLAYCLTHCSINGNYDYCQQT